MKKVLSLAIAAALAAPLAAMADATVYGKVRLSLDSVDDGNDSQIEIQDQTSRLGVKGSEDLGDGLKAIYTIEYGVKIATASNEFSGDGSLSARNAFVGLAGGFGTVNIGRHDTPLKMSTGKLDYFADTRADFNNSYMAGMQDRRADGTLAYISPDFGGLTVAVALVPGENSEANGLADAYSAAAMYSNGGLFLSAAIEAADGNIDAIGTDGADLTQYRLGGGFDFGDFKVAGVYESHTIDGVGGGADDEDTRWALSGGMKLGAGMVKATYQTNENDASNDETTAWAIGYDYNLSKRTDVYVLYLDSTTEFGDNETADDEATVLGVGINHAF